MTEIVTVARDNPYMFALMANTLQPAHPQNDKMDIAQTLMECAHVQTFSGN